MIGLLRGRRLLAPVLFSTLLSGGCQLFGTDSKPITPAGAFDKKKINTTEQPLSVPTAERKNEGGANTQQAGDGFRPKREVEGREVSAADAGLKKDATNVVYIPPTSSIAIRPTSAPSGPSGVPVRPDLSAQTSTGAAGTILNSSPLNKLDRETDAAVKVNTAAPETKSLEVRMLQLEQRLEQRDRAVKQTGAEVQAATEELHRTLGSVETWRKEVDEARAKLQKREKEDIETMKLTVKTLERMLAEDAPGENRREGERKADR